MKRIYLSKQEKQLLRAISAGVDARPAGQLAQIEYGEAIRSLEIKGLVAARYEEGGGIVDARITRKGFYYLSTYPTLRNPIPWRDAAQWATVALSAGALAASLFACVRAGLLQ